MNPSAPSKAEIEILANFRYRLRCFLRTSEQLTRDAGVTNLQYLLLLHVEGFPGRNWASITELAERLQAKHHGVVALVNRSEKLGLVSRRPGRVDGREVEVHLTRSGARTVRHLAQLHRDELIRMAGVFAVPSQRQLRATRSPTSRQRRVTHAAVQ